MVGCKHRPFAIVAVATLLATHVGSAAAQSVISLEPQQNQVQTGVSAPPSVGNGVANGVVKAPGAPSVGDGRANGVVKQGGAPSVGDGIANGVMKSTTVNQ